MQGWGHEFQGYREGTGLRDAREARPELCRVAESRPCYRAGDSK